MSTNNPSTDRRNVPGEQHETLSNRAWLLATLGGRLSRRTAVVLWLSTLIALSLFGGWSWLVAAGLSSIILSLLPCVAMCALGLCGGSGRDCANKGADKGSAGPNP